MGPLIKNITLRYTFPFTPSISFKSETLQLKSVPFFYTRQFYVSNSNNSIQKIQFEIVKYIPCRH